MGEFEQGFANGKVKQIEQDKVTIGNFVQGLP